MGKRVERHTVCGHSAQRRLVHYSGANAWKKIGKVPNSPNSVSTTKAVVAERNIRSRSRHMKWSTTHAITKTRRPDGLAGERSNRLVEDQPLPERFAGLGEVVNRPRANDPIPAATSTAASGPSGFAAVTSSPSRTSRSVTTMSTRSVLAP